MSDKQIRQFSSSILISDIISYIDSHQKEYEEFLKEEELKKELNSNQVKGGKNNEVCAY